MHGTQIKIGTWLYNGSVPTGVRILESDTAFGTSDFEDQPDVREDKAMKCFYVEWCVAGTIADWRSIGFGPYEALAEAEAYVAETTNGTILWRK